MARLHVHETKRTSVSNTHSPSRGSSYLPTEECEVAQSKQKGKHSDEGQGKAEEANESEQLWGGLLCLTITRASWQPEQQ